MMMLMMIMTKMIIIMSCLAVLTAQSSKELPVSLGVAERRGSRYYLVGREHFSQNVADLVEVLNIDVSRDSVDVFSRSFVSRQSPPYYFCCRG